MSDNDFTALLAHAIPAETFEASLLAALAENVEDIAIGDTVRILADVNGPDADYRVTRVADDTADVYSAETGPVTIDRALIARI
jgi:hypothetical protein